MLTSKELLTMEEKEIIKNIESKSDKHVRGSWRGWITLAWCTKLLNEMRREKLIGICGFNTILGMISNLTICIHSADEKGHEKLVSEIKEVYSTNYKLKSLVWVNFPLAYTQTVLLVTWTLYALLLISTQYIHPTGFGKGDNGTSNEEGHLPQGAASEHNTHIFYRFFEFLFYLGWFQVAKIMLNPFGQDDDDIDVNYIIDRNLSTSFLIVNGDSEDFPNQPIDTFEGRKIPTYALEHNHNERGPVTFDKILEGVGGSDKTAESGGWVNM